MGRDVDLIKERVSVLDLVRSYVTLAPAGKNFKGLCPFHNEKTPSFIVSPDRKTWHCFGCGKGGDVIRFVMEYENLEFREALRFLAERAGLELASLDPQAEREFGVLYDLHDAAADFYCETLARAPLPLEYLKGRTLAKETIDTFRLGFAPQGDQLTTHLLKKGFAVEDIARAGLTVKAASGLYRDKFQNRIIFPLTNHVGKVVAFTGRLFGATPSSSVELPKYLNSPETPIFSKSKVLYGFSETKQDIARARAAVLVEGQMDMLLAWQSGVKHAVAISGTGLTEQHLERLRRVADTLVVSFDSDEAGVKALDRALDALAPYDFHVQALDLGKYKDPGEACEADPGFLPRAVAEAAPAFARLATATFTPEVAGDVAKKKRAVRGLLGKIGRLRSAVEQDTWLQELAKASGVPQVTLLAELAGLAVSSQAPSGAAGGGVGEAGARKMPRREAIASRLAVVAFTNPEFLATVRQHIELVPEPYRTLLASPGSEAAAAAEMKAAALPEDPRKLDEEFRDLMRQLQIETLIERQAAARVKLRVAEAEENETEMARLGVAFQEISRELDLLRGSR